MSSAAGRIVRPSRPQKTGSLKHAWIGRKTIGATVAPRPHEACEIPR
jgi:hypothetical protein